MRSMINSLLDPVVNFGKVTVSTGYNSTDATITLAPGDGSKLPDPSNDGQFNLVWFNNSTYSDPADDPYVEIVRCILRTDDTLILYRAQEGTIASNKNIPWKIYRMLLSTTKKTIGDIQTESQSNISAHSALSSGIHGVGIDTIDGVGARNIAISSHSSATSNVHGFDASGDAPAQVHGISKHTGTIGTEANITFAATGGHAHTGSDSTKVDHNDLSTIGTNTHAQIDTAIETTLPGLVTAHAGLTTAHGAIGTVVGTTNSQILINKTLTSPAIDDFTNSNHTHSAAGATGGIIDHTTLNNIGSNTHTQIDTAITASNGHIASNAAHGATGAILGTTTANATYAPIAKGVTNGDSHDHNGGDGAQINHTTLSNIGTNTHAQIDIAIETTLPGLVTTHAGYTTGVHGVTGDYILGTEDLDPDPALGANSDLKIATQKAVKAYADQLIAAANATVYKGAIDCSGSPNYPAADAGWLYRISVAGKIGGVLGINVEAGDMIICLTDATASGIQATVGSNWNVIQANIDGAVIGPSSSVDNRVAFFNGSTGKLIKDSGLTLSGTNTGDQTLFDATAPTTQTFGDSAVVGTATVAAHRDHKHAMMVAPTTVSGNAGTVTVGTTSSTTCSVGLFESISGSLSPKTSAGLTYNATTNNLVMTGNLSISGQYLSSKKVGSFTRTMGSTGSQPVTGIGFKPSALELIACVYSTVITSIGYADASSGACMFNAGDGTFNTMPNPIFLVSSPGNVFMANISSFDSDGFTLSWGIGVGNPTAPSAITIKYLAHR